MLDVLLFIVGLIVALIVLLIAVSQNAGKAWERKVKTEISELFSSLGAREDKPVVTEAALQGLPEIVQKWLKDAGVVGKKRVASVRLKQKGGIRTKAGQPWMPFEAVQYYTIDAPGFIWSVKAKAAPFITIVGRDRYFRGKGHMLIKLLALKTVADGKGKGMDQGSMLRFLSEIIWFPSAALSDYITWEPVDDTSARATMRYKDMEVTGVFSFNEKGEPIHFRADRYYTEPDGSQSLQPWSGVMSEHKAFNGVKIPAVAEVMWNLETGDFTYFKGEITNVEYDILSG